MALLIGNTQLKIIYKKNMVIKYIIYSVSSKGFTGTVVNRECHF